MTGKKSGKFDKKGIEGLAKDKPVVYKIENDKGKPLSIGTGSRARCGRNGWSRCGRSTESRLTRR